MDVRQGDATSPDVLAGLADARDPHCRQTSMPSTETTPTQQHQRRLRKESKMHRPGIEPGASRNCPMDGNG
jgi:hypothetical protein